MEWTNFGRYVRDSDGAFIAEAQNKNLAEQIALEHNASEGIPRKPKMRIKTIKLKPVFSSGAAIPSLLALKRVMKITGYSSDAIYLREKKGTFPKRVFLGHGSRGAWVESEVRKWVIDAIAGRDRGQK